MRVEISGSQIQVFSYDSNGQEEVLSVPPHDVLQFSTKLAGENYTKSVEEVQSCLERIATILKRLPFKTGYGVGYSLEDSNGNSYTSEPCLIWSPKESNDLDKTVSQVFGDLFVKHLEHNIYILEVDGKNVLLQCRGNHYRG